MAPRQPTSYDVAKLAGVSQATVSRVFSEDRYASPETRAKILAAAEKLNYRPNRIARSLSFGRTGLVGLIISDETQQNYPAAVNSIMSILRSTGGNVLLQVIEGDLVPSDTVRQLLAYKVDFIISASVMAEEDALFCIGAQTPLVMLNATLDMPGVDQVLSDHYEASRQVMMGLARAGVGYCAHITGRAENQFSERCRRGCLDGCVAAGLAEPLMAAGDFSYDGGYRAALDLIEREPALEAIVASSDSMAIGAIDALVHERGKRIPDDIMIVGFVDTEVAKYKAYELTSVRQPMEEMLQAALNLALQRSDGPDRATSNVILQSTIVMRRTARWPDVDRRGSMPSIA